MFSKPPAVSLIFLLLCCFPLKIRFCEQTNVRSQVNLCGAFFLNVIKSECFRLLLMIHQIMQHLFIECFCKHSKYLQVFKTVKPWKLTGVPEVRTRCFHCQAFRFDSWSRNKDPKSRVVQPKKKERKKLQNSNKYNFLSIQYTFLENKC